MDFHIDVIKDARGRRELHCYIRSGERTAHLAFSVRSLVFWLAFLLLMVPASAFQLMPRMTHMATAPVSAPIAIAGRSACLSQLNNATSIEDLGSAGVAGSVAAGSAASLLMDEGSMAALELDGCLLDGASDAASDMLENGAEDLVHSKLEHNVIEFDMSDWDMSGFDHCFVDASSNDVVMACLQQVHLATLDDVSISIVNEVLNSKEDGTLLSILANVVQSGMEGGSNGVSPLEAVSLKRMAFRACVSASVHKMAVFSFPYVSACMLNMAPDAVHAITTLTG